MNIKEQNYSVADLLSSNRLPAGSKRFGIAEE